MFINPLAVPPQISYYLGLDLGQAQDFTALVIAERADFLPVPTEPDKPLTTYTIRHLQRWPLKVSYVDIVRDLKAMLSKLPTENPTVAVDKTGVGSPVVDQIRASGLPAFLRSCVITSGHHAHWTGDSWHVPKRELVSVVRTLLDSDRLSFADLPDLKVLLRELDTFKAKITVAGNETFEAWRERDHDDMVLAVSLCLWAGEKDPPTIPAEPEPYTPPLPETPPTPGGGVWPAEQGHRPTYGRPGGLPF